MAEELNGPLVNKESHLVESGCPRHCPVEGHIEPLGLLRRVGEAQVLEVEWGAGLVGADREFGVDRGRG